MSTNIETQQLYTLARNSVLIHTAMDYVIFFSINKMKFLDISTDPKNVNTGIIEQIKIDDPYFIPKSPIFHVPVASPVTPVIPLLGGVFIEDEFNIGDLSRNLFVLINSFPFSDVKDKVRVLEAILTYLDHTSALFIQTSVAYIILYPEKFLMLKSMDSKSRQDIIKDKIKEKYRYISNAESESISDFISLLIDTLGSNPVEPNLIKLLDDIDKTGTGLHSWGNGNTNIPMVDIKKFTNTIELFHRLSNCMKPDLISGIPRDLAKEIDIDPATGNPTDLPLINDLVRVVIEIEFMEKIIDIWRFLLESDNVTPVIISFLKDELPKIFGYFEEAEPLPAGGQYVDMSQVMVKKYLDTFLNQTLLSKLTELSGRPSSDAALKIIRCLKIDSGTSFPVPDLNIINFLFTITFILQENPALSTLHKRSELFELFNDSTTVPPGNPRFVHSEEIFPGIIFKDGRAPLLESVGLEQEYNGIKNGITDLDLRIGQVGQLKDLLKVARGIPL